MNTDLQIQKLNATSIKLDGDRSVLLDIAERFTFEVPGARFIPDVVAGTWDGKIRLLHMGNKTLGLGLYEKLLDEANSLGYSTEYIGGEHPFNKRKITPQKFMDFVNSLNIPEKLTPYDFQLKSAFLSIRDRRLTVLSPTATGKSLIIYIIVRWFLSEEQEILLVVPRVALLKQMEKDFIEYNNGISLDPYLIKAGVDKKTDNPLIITTWQSIYKQRKDWFSKFDLIIGDEVHNFEAKSLSGIMAKSIHTNDRIGFTGTLSEAKTNELTVVSNFGPTYQAITYAEAIRRKIIADLDIKSCVLKYPMNMRKLHKKDSYQEEVDFCNSYQPRNEFLSNILRSLSGNTLVLFRFVEKHGIVLHEHIKKNTNKPLYLVHGGVPSDEREDIRQKAINADEDYIIIASQGTFSEGINIPNIDNVIFASATKSKIKVLQSIGRGLRISKNKNKCVLYDLVDDLRISKRKNFSIKHYEERVKFYNEEQFNHQSYQYNLL